MKSLFLFVLLVSMNPLRSPVDHDIHMSMVRLTMEDEDMIDLTVQVFLDDLMNSVGLTPGEPLPDDYTSADDLLQQFVQDHLYISINDEVIQPLYIENAASTPAVWITYQITDLPKDIQSIHVKNDIMLDLFDDQLNMLHIELPNHTSAYKLDSKNTSVLIKI